GESEPWRGPTELGEASVPPMSPPAPEPTRVAAEPTPPAAPQFAPARSIVPILVGALAAVLVLAVAGWLGWRALAPRPSLVATSQPAPSATRVPASSLAP